MSRYKLFIVFACSFLAGIAAASFYFDGNVLKAGFITGVFLFLFFRIIWKDEFFGLCFIVFVLGFVFGIFRFFISEDPGTNSGLADGGSFLFDFLRSLNSLFSKQLATIFNEPYGGFMAGLLLGNRSEISYDLMQNFNTVGLTHIIAISGYNITLVISIVCGLFSFLSRKKRVIFSIVFVVCFVILVGSSASVVRAAVMGIIGLVAVYFGRVYVASVSLIASAFFMNLWNPRLLVYDVGFELSVLATAGLVYVSAFVSENFVNKYFKFLPAFAGIRESFSMTLSAQIFVLPLILVYFGRLSLVSPIANLIVLPFIPWIMLFGFLSGFANFFSGWLGNFFGFTAYILMKLVISIIGGFAILPFAAIKIEWFGFWMAATCYFLIWRLLCRWGIKLF
ncbi:MAG: ComEC/Rec2 family competence protein [Patescibacteria group bacterium]